ncbi:hypothetical protein BEL04_23040 [Mucilaginibacter sp. PPCGB 2223]|uniref:hypothetical protein n=1 Tax=Mucilaginibacter sp. PPCGB 2223 TaxID=1886027 RepID=UPI0008253BC5|nr:hypothetical protein [Mucilaginibacter sp. PPCGB 2223]OCX50648.1 hypothetical protein BEL04_23040 [Mucilaginibacter sp. PPCGB 2223]
MGQDYQEMVFETQIDPFVKRMWQVYLANFIITPIFCIVSSCFFKEFNAIVLLWLATVTCIFLSTVYSSYKWSRNKVRSISLVDGIFKAIVTRKNSDSTYLIPQESISTKLKWEGGRPRVLTLMIFSKNNPIVKVYSGRQKNEYDLEDIAYQIKKRLNK